MTSSELTNEPDEMQRRACDLTMNGHVEWLAQAYANLYYAAFWEFVCENRKKKDDDQLIFTDESKGADRCATYIAGRSMGAMFDWNNIGTLTG